MSDTASTLYAACTIDCERQPVCLACARRKAPLGRDLVDPAGYCTADDCDGYRDVPTPGHLWPGELRRIREAERDE